MHVSTMHINVHVHFYILQCFLDVQASLEPTMSVCPCVCLSVLISLRNPIFQPNEVRSSPLFSVQLNFGLSR